MDKRALRAAFKNTLPILAGYIVLGFGFGVLITKAGYGPIWAFGMATTIYAGAMQYVGVELLSSHVSLISVAITTLMVQARHLFYGFSLVDKYKGAGLKKFLMIAEITDETYALISASKYPEGVNPHWYYFFICIFDHIYWIIGCMLGALVGSTVEFDARGIEFSMTAIFVSVFVDQWKNSKDHTPSLIGLLSTLVCLIIFGSKNFLIPAMLIITALLFLFKNRLEQKKEGGVDD